MARLLAAATWRWLSEQLRRWAAAAQSEIRQPQLEKLSSPLARLLEAADGTLRGEIAAALRECGENLLECLVPALRLADARKAAGMDTIARDCAEWLAAIVARPSREEDDWSIEWTGCGCGHCETLRTFLLSRSQRALEWPLAEKGRHHVQDQIDLAALPVRHQTRRQGRPYTLVLKKTDELFTRATTTRQRAVTDLAWLRSTRAGAGGEPTRTA